MKIIIVIKTGSLATAIEGFSFQELLNHALQIW